MTNGSLSVSLLRAGELFGAAALYNDAPEFAAVLTARSPCRVLFLPQETLDRLLGRSLSSAATTSGTSPGASGSCPGGCARWPRPARREAGPVSADPPLRRATAPVRHRPGQAPGHQPRLLYRAFQALEDARLIRREGKSMYVLDPAGLEGVL